MSSTLKSPVAPFISKLFELTNEFEGPDVCFEWSDDGTQFWVSNIEIFSRDVLPAYFKHNNYASFIRQLNIYGFRRSTEYLAGSRHGPSVEVFRHPLFIRGRKDLLQQIVRRSSAASASSVASAAGSSVCNLHAFGRADVVQRKVKAEDDAQSESGFSVYDAEHAAGAARPQDVAVLKAKMLHMEMALAQLQEQNQLLYAQQTRQNLQVWTGAQISRLLTEPGADGRLSVTGVEILPVDGGAPEQLRQALAMACQRRAPHRRLVAEGHGQGML